MLRILRGSVAALIVFGLSASVARAATTADQLVGLARAGLDDDILIALIQTDGSVFQLTADDILDLHRQGLSNRVILAMLQTAMPPVADNRSPDAPVPQEPAAFVPEAMPVQPQPPAAYVRQTVFQQVGPPAATEVLVPVAVPVAVPVHGHLLPSASSSPVYWGWGGQRRPDSWNDGSPPARTVPVRDAPSHDAPSHDSKDKGKKDR